ncbi:MAG: hypothetical protein FWC96_05495 [Oscillospiraceae bacterium]|nr:hypothetical protein [Oscillospiraceae bacterium]
MKNPYDGIYIDDQDLEQFTRESALEMTDCGGASTIHTVRAARKTLDFIDAARRQGTKYVRDHISIPRDIEWLLDNWYIAEREGKVALADIRKFHSLPGVTKKRLRVSAAAQAFVISGRCKITGERLYAFLNAFQTSMHLSEDELHAFIPALRLELINALAEECRCLISSMNGDESADSPSGLFEAIFTSLRVMSGFDSRELLERVNRIERALLRDPAGQYGLMDDDTRHIYRREISRLARLHGMDEESTANRAVELSGPDGHVGQYIFLEPLGSPKKRRTGVLYICLVTFTSLFFALLIGFLLERPMFSILLIIPLSEIIKNIADYFILRFSMPKRALRFELADGIPPEGKTLCAVSVLLSSEKSGTQAAELLEAYRISNRDAGENLLFALLCDLPEAKSAELPEDAVFINSAAQKIESLNEKYGGGFYLYYRKRVKSERDGIFLGWERKRGAILELFRHLRGKESGIITAAGDDSSNLTRRVKYLIALDSDTRLTAGSARELVGAAMHPQNKPVIDKDKGVVIEGSAIIQPRVSVNLHSAACTDFSLFFAGQGGTDPYGGAASDLYQNMLGIGSFTGKGIIDIDAYLECLDTRIPENQILSHDLIEGAFLRCSYAGDIELTDGFPSNVKSYYNRMHRWTRGDWQSVPWLGKHVKNSAGQKCKNPLSRMDKWKIIDNLRRSLVPPLLMAGILLGLLRYNRPCLVTLTVAIAAIFTDLLISGAVSLFSRRRGRIRYVSQIISGFGGQLSRTIVRLLLLPYEAWVTASAIATALYRMCFSRKRMLEWTTAADSERFTKSNLASYFIRMWPCLAAAAATMFVSPYIFAAALAVIWTLTPLYAYSLGLPRKQRRVISAESRLFLTRCAGDAWRYFEELLTPEDNFLPPDNFQEQPSVGIAHRTSPTNIGLALISALAAVDLGVCKREVAVSLISNTLDTILWLDKWRGHLYNWYDTTTLRVLNPAYVSSVDCGNFAACLIALREGLYEYGEDQLAAITDSLLRDMNFADLFDEKKMLFHIGRDVSKDAPSDSWYDLMASEAMLTSFVAIARGDIPHKHWRRLSRALVSLDGYRGMVSWTGTMFEYLMPPLLLPHFRDSLIYESLKFSVYAQKKHASKNQPWGMSESAFYDFDHTLSYRYKAHGVQNLALKRGMDRDIVVSPYSSFLALLVDLKGALFNLRRLQKLGAEGRYGFFEAVDYTPSRLRGNQYEIVRTYMAHHVGMSLVAIDNTLNSGVMQKRFLRDKEMAAFCELLQEKVPVSGVVLRQPPRDVPEKPRRASTSSWRYESGDGIDSSFPHICLLGNGAYTVTMAETGQSRSVWNGVTLTKSGTDPLSREMGMAFFLKCGDSLISLLPSPVFDLSVSYSTQMTGGMCRITAKKGGINTSVTVTVPEGDSGELRTLEIASNTLQDAELICYFEPVLARRADFDSHPAFSKMSLETFEHDGTVIIRRRPRSKGNGLTVAVGCDRPYSFDTSREKALGRGGIRSLISALKREPSGSTGSVLDPCILMRVKLRLDPNAPCRVSFALAPSWNAEGASAAAQRILQTGPQSASSRLDITAARLGLTADHVSSAMALAREIVYPSPYRRIPSELTPGLSHGQRGMWSLGVSGDYPILVSPISAEAADLSRAETLIKTHAFLAENSVSFDLVFLLSDGGDYRSALKSGVLDILRSMNLEWRHGARCGVHTAEESAEGVDVVKAAAFRVIGDDSDSFHDNESHTPEPLVFYNNPQHTKALEYGYNDDDNSFTFLCDGSMPPNSWSHMLSNGEFGYIASDAGTGHMWHHNARENKINRWYNDSLATEGTEQLYLVKDGVKTSLFAAPDGHACRVTYGFGYARWEKTIGDTQVTLTAFVPPDTACRVFIIETDAPPEAEILYYTDLVIGSNEAESSYVTTEFTDSIIQAYNNYSADFSETVFMHLASMPVTAFTCSKNGYLTGVMDGTTGTGFTPCVATAYPVQRKLVIVSGCAGLDVLKALVDPTAAEAKLNKTIAHWQRITSRFTVKTPSEDLNRYLNGWAIYQTYACRILGRSSLYQSGGAYGFRDQLQDVCALTAITPEETFVQIVRAAEHQFEEGDVQHWWHPGTERESLGNKGVRTKCSDDLLWLPYALCEYIDVTGDDSICDCPAQYLTSPTLTEDEIERYEQPHKSARIEPIFMHALRAIDLVFTRGAGEHGLALIGSGDWNDGMNLVGVEGRGESVWLTWFLIHTAERFAGLCEKRGNPGAAARFRESAAIYRRAAEEAWDGNWYLRGYFDDGTPLGSAGNDECRIDSIAQSFSTLAGADPEKIKTALLSTVDVLFNRKDRVIQLFDPPFSTGRTSPGYIKGYSPGFRENGGQYTHGAIWLSMALFKSGMTELGWETLEAILPQSRPLDVYRTEPYVLAADVYSNELHLGRGGWTWYTGASGWYYRVALEQLLGITIRSGILRINPNLPAGWDGFELVWKNAGAEYHIKINDNGSAIITRDGIEIKDDPSIQLAGDTADLTEI